MYLNWSQILYSHVFWLWAVNSLAYFHSLCCGHWHQQYFNTDFNLHYGRYKLILGHTVSIDGMYHGEVCFWGFTRPIYWSFLGQRLYHTHVTGCVVWLCSCVIVNYVIGQLNYDLKYSQKPTSGNWIFGETYIIIITRIRLVRRVCFFIFWAPRLCWPKQADQAKGRRFSNILI